MEAMCHNPRERKSKSWKRGVRWREKREKGKVSKENKEKERKGKKGKGGKYIFAWFWYCIREERERERGVRSSTFSLRFMEIEPSIFVGTRDKVHIHDESFE